jgi:hypothetical protein
MEEELLLGALIEMGCRNHQPLDCSFSLSNKSMKKIGELIFYTKIKGKERRTK